MSNANSVDDRRRAISRHTLSYILCSISELFRHYDFDPLDLLIIHAVLNANVIMIMKNKQLDKEFGGIDAVEPDELKQGISRATIARFLSLPLETVRRRVDSLKEVKVLSDEKDGLIVSQSNQFKFGNNHELQIINTLLVKKLLSDLRRVANGNDRAGSPAVRRRRDAEIGDLGKSDNPMRPGGCSWRRSPRGPGRSPRATP